MNIGIATDLGDADLTEIAELKENNLQNLNIIIDEVDKKINQLEEDIEGLKQNEEIEPEDLLELQKVQSKADEYNEPIKGKLEILL